MNITALWLSLLSFLTDAKILAVFLILLGIRVLYRFRAPKQSLMPEPSALRVPAFYSVIMSVLCLALPTAWILMHYHSLHYGYAYIWSAVPILPMTAVLLVLFPEWLMLQAGTHASDRKIRIVSVLLAVMILLLCGDFGFGSWQSDTYPGDREELALAEQTLSASADSALILAPSDLTEYLHLTGTPYHTLYGRNMWDNSLQGYLYDTYPQELIDLYEVMRDTEVNMTFSLTGDSIEKGIRFCKAAQDANVSILVLPRTIFDSDDDVRELADACSLHFAISDSEAGSSAGYYILSVR